MSLPTPPPEIERQPVNRDFNNLDSLIEELGAPKEQIIQSHTTSDTEINSERSSTGNYFDTPVEPIPAEIAALSGKTITGTIDTVISTGLSLYSGAKPEKYEASDKQIEKLNLAWAAIAQKYNYRVEDSPWFNVMLLNVAVYFPTWKEAQKDHRFAEMEQRIKENELKAKEMEARVKAMEEKPRP